MKTVSSLLALSLLIQTAYANPLADYRKTYGSHTVRGQAGLEQKTESRIANIRKALKTGDLNFRYPNVKLANIDRDIGASLYMKSILSRVSKSLKNQISYEKPIKFDPSEFTYEIDRKVNATRNAACQAVIGNNKEILINQIYSQSHADNSSRTSHLEADVQNGQSALAAAITNYINKNAPGVTAILGSIYQIEVVDNTVTRIRFTRNKKALSNPRMILPEQESTAISLEMLSTFVSQYDALFVEGNRCFVKMIGAELNATNAKIAELKESFKFKYVPSYGNEEMKRLENSQAKYQAAYRYIVGKYNGAVNASRNLIRLTMRQRFVMLDLMLQLKRNDIPVADDVQPLNQLAARSGSNEATADASYYRNLEEELFRVEEYIREYTRSNQVNQQIISEIKGGK